MIDIHALAVESVSVCVTLDLESVRSPVCLNVECNNSANVLLCVATCCICTCKGLYALFSFLLSCVFIELTECQTTEYHLLYKKQSGAADLAACIIIMGDLNGGELSLLHGTLPCTVGRGHINDIFKHTGGCKSHSR